MNILLTGGCGYIGTVLTEKLLSLGHHVTVVDTMWFGNHLKRHPCLEVLKADILDIDRVPMKGNDAILHLANIANDPCSELNSKLSWEVNALGAMRLVEKAISCGVGQFIYASSGSVYGVKEEEKVTEGLSLVPISDYNKTKMVAERILLSYANKLLVQCVRPATVCGYSPRMRLDLSVNMLTVQALENGRITVFGGDQQRPNIHIQDMINVYLHFLKRGSKAPGIYNAGFENMSIMDIAKRIVKRVPADIVVQDSNDPRSYRLCSDKLISTGFVPQHSVGEAIDQVVEAYRAGNISNDDICYNIKQMKKMKLSADNK